LVPEVVLLQLLVPPPVVPPQLRLPLRRRRLRVRILGNHKHRIWH